MSAQQITQHLHFPLPTYVFSRGLPFVLIFMTWMLHVSCFVNSFFRILFFTCWKCFKSTEWSANSLLTVMCAFYLQLQSNIFGGLDESLLARAEALAAVDIVSQTKSHHHPHHHHSPFKPDSTYHTMNTLPCTSSSSSVPISHPSALASHHHHHHHHHHQPHQALEGDLLDHITPGLALAGAMAGPDGSMVSTPTHPAHMAGMNHMHQAAIMAHAMGCNLTWLHERRGCRSQGLGGIRWAL